MEFHCLSRTILVYKVKGKMQFLKTVAKARYQYLKISDNKQIKAKIG